MTLEVTVSTTPGARVPSSTGNPLRTDAVVRALLDTVKTGATVDAQGHPYRGDGILVALPEYGVILTPRGVRGLWSANLDIPDFVSAWVETRGPVVTAIGASPARYFGIWDDGTNLHFDVVEAFSSAEEDRAVEAGRARNQISIWHHGRQEEIPTGGTGGAL
jgi:hypothetical protein